MGRWEGGWEGLAGVAGLGGEGLLWCSRGCACWAELIVEGLVLRFRGFARLVGQVED